VAPRTAITKMNVRMISTKSRQERVVVVQAVGAKAAVKAQQHTHDEGADDAAYELRHEIADKVVLVHLAAEEDAERDSRVDVAAAHVADGIRHGNDGQAKGQGREHVGRIGARAVTTHRRGGATAADHEDRGADALGNVLLHAVHTEPP